MQFILKLILVILDFTFPLLLFIAHLWIYNIFSCFISYGEVFEVFEIVKLPRYVKLAIVFVFSIVGLYIFHKLKQIFPNSAHMTYTTYIGIRCWMFVCFVPLFFRVTVYDILKCLLIEGITMIPWYMQEIGLF